MQNLLIQINQEQEVHTRAIEEQFIDPYIRLYAEFITAHDPAMGQNPVNTQIALPFVDNRHLNDITAALAGAVTIDKYSYTDYFCTHLRALFEVARTPRTR